VYTSVVFMRNILTTDVGANGTSGTTLNDKTRTLSRQSEAVLLKDHPRPKRLEDPSEKNVHIRTGGQGWQSSRPGQIPVKTSLRL
jgi:hypothetical protein